MSVSTRCESRPCRTRWTSLPQLHHLEKPFATNAIWMRENVPLTPNYFMTKWTAVLNLGYNLDKYYFKKKGYMLVHLCICCYTKCMGGADFTTLQFISCLILNQKWQKLNVVVVNCWIVIHSKGEFNQIFYMWCILIPWHSESKWCHWWLTSCSDTVLFLWDIFLHLIIESILTFTISWSQRGRDWNINWFHRPI